MPLILPFFKFNPMDWLTSEKMAVMELCHVGAYINLLSHAWTTGICTLPSDEIILKKLCKWDDRKHTDFHLVLHCFEPFKKTNRIYNARLYREWEEANDRSVERRESGMKGATKRWAPKPIRTPRATPIQTSSDPDFEQFWNAYPRKVGKKKAQIAWRKATDKPEVVDMIKAVDLAKHTEQWTKDNGQYIPHPSTWLNEGRWADEQAKKPPSTMEAFLSRQPYKRQEVL